MRLRSFVTSAGLSVCLLACASPMQKADNDAKLRQANTPVEEKVATPFDEKQAKAAMVEGDATIKGVLYHKVVTSGGKNAGSDPPFSIAPAKFLTGVKVWLYPETAHLTELLRLEKENRRSRTWSKTAQLKHYVTDERLYKYRLESTTDTSGRYFFYKMKPGRYYIVAQNQNVTSTGSEPVVDGVAVVSNGYGVPIGTVQQYRNQDFRVKTPVEYGEFVEVKNGQKELKIESRMRFNPDLF
jgi:hypothetical protein